MDKQKKQENVHASVKGGMKYNTGRLLMVLHKPLLPQGVVGAGSGGGIGADMYDTGIRYGGEEPDMDNGTMLPMP